MSRRFRHLLGVDAKGPAWPPASDRRGPTGYAVAVLAATGATAALLLPAVGQGMGSVLFLAVVVSAWYGGLRPGLLATALADVELVAILWYYGLRLRPAHYVGLALFTAGGVLVTLLVEALHAALRRVEKAHREAEEGRRWLDAVLTSIGDAVIATDASGDVTFTNPVARELTGWDEDEATGRPLGDVFRIVSEEDHRPAVNPVERVIREGIVLGLANHTALIARDGTERPIEDSAAPIRGVGGVEGAVLVFHDVTERRRAEAERERLLSALRENDKLKDEFLAMLAHELRNPLAVIGNAVRLPGIEGEGEDVGWPAEVIGRQVGHLTRLIDDLLDVSRITRGRITLRPERVDAATVLDRALAAVAPLARGRHHTVVGDYPRGLLWLDGDPLRLEQVFVNLLTNAVKYTEDGGRIEVRGLREGGDVVVAVRDNGVGLSPELLPRVFDLFTQGDRSLARSEGGLGIGLTVVKALVQLHGGTVKAGSAGAGGGSEFLVRLPVAEAPPAPSALPAQAPVRANVRRSRVLIVDDNPDLVRGMARLLGRLGHDVRTALNGPEAIEAARSHAPEFVLLDIGLPGMDGYEVAERLRGEGCCAGSVFIAISGYGQDADRHRSRSAGFDHHLVKPVDHDFLTGLLSAPRDAAG